MLLLNQQMGSWENFTETWMKASVRFRTVAVHGLQQCIVPQSAQRRERASECINTLIIQELPKQSRFLISTSQFKVLYKKHLRLHMKTKQHNICEENRATVVDRLMVSCKCQPSSTQLECISDSSVTTCSSIASFLLGSGSAPPSLSHMKEQIQVLPGWYPSTALSSSPCFHWRSLGTSPPYSWLCWVIQQIWFQHL